MGERVKDVYVMRDMKDVYVMGERGYLSRTSPPETRFLPHTPFAGKPETRFYLKISNCLIISHLFKLLIINVLL